MWWGAEADYGSDYWLFDSDAEPPVEPPVDPPAPGGGFGGVGNSTSLRQFIRRRLKTKQKVLVFRKEVDRIVASKQSPPWTPLLMSTGVAATIYRGEHGLRAVLPDLRGIEVVLITERPDDDLVLLLTIIAALDAEF